MSYILSAGTIQMPSPIDEEQFKLNLGITEIEGAVVEGQITDCDTGEAIVGAVVKAFFTNPDTEELEGINHTFSGCNGEYILYIPPTAKYIDSETGEEVTYPLAGETITIQAVGSDITVEPCQCPEVLP